MGNKSKQWCEAKFLISKTLSKAWLYITKYVEKFEKITSSGYIKFNYQRFYNSKLIKMYTNKDFLFQDGSTNARLI